MDISSVFGGDTLKAADLQGREIGVIISDVSMKKFDNGNKIILSFEGKKKTLVCNKTNANRIAHVYGTNTDNWIGQEITLYVDLVEYAGRPVDAIRVRAKRRAPVTTTAPQRMADDPAPGDMSDEIPF